MSYDITIEEVATQPMVSIRRVTPLEQIGPSIGQIYGELGAFLGAQGIAPCGAPFTRYHGCTDAGMDIEPGMPIAAPTDGAGAILAGTLPGGKAAVYTHTGPYHLLGPAHEAVQAWITEQGLTAAGPPWESYLNDPGQVPESELQTRIFSPLA